MASARSHTVFVKIFFVSLRSMGLRRLAAESVYDYALFVYQAFLSWFMDRKAFLFSIRRF